jgi:rhomboid protease GluP
MNFLILLAVFGGLAYRITAPEDRKRYVVVALAYLREVKIAATAPRPEYDAFRTALRARTRHLIVTPAIVALHVTVLAGMLFGASAIGDSATLVNWGASLGPRTTNGEWWRLATAAFVHRGTFQLLVDVMVLIQLGAIVERLVGPFAFGAVYLAAGALGGLVHLSVHPVDPGISTSSAIFGVYGLLLACIGWQRLARRGAVPQLDAEQASEPTMTVPHIAMKRLGMVGAIFFLCSALSGMAGAAEFSGVVVGLAYGVVLGAGISSHAPARRSIAITAAATAVLGVACALPLRNIADVKPALAYVIDTEERTATDYKAGFDRFKRGRMTADALADLAERAIVPKLQAADARLQALEHIPPEHQPVVADAREFVRLRCDSWRARAEAIRRTNKDLRQLPGGAADPGWRIQAEARFRKNMAAAGTAESTERLSLEAFDRVRRSAPLSPD